MQLVKLPALALFAIVVMATSSLGCRVATAEDIKRGIKLQPIIRYTDIPAGTTYVRSKGLDNPQLSVIFYSSGNKVRFYSNEERNVEYLFRFNKYDGHSIHYVVEPFDLGCFLYHQPAAGDVRDGMWTAMRPR